MKVKELFRINEGNTDGAQLLKLTLLLLDHNEISVNNKVNTEWLRLPHIPDSYQELFNTFKVC